MKKLLVLGGGTAGTMVVDKYIKNSIQKNGQLRLSTKTTTISISPGFFCCPLAFTNPKSWSRSGITSSQVRGIHSC